MSNILYNRVRTIEPPGKYKNVNEMTGVPLPRTPEKDDAGIIVHGIPVIGPPSGETDFRSR